MMTKMKRVAVLCMVMMLVFTQSAKGAHWADDSFNYAQNNQLLPEGYSQEQVSSRLDNPISRGDLTALLVHGLQIDLTGQTLAEGTFADQGSISPTLSPYLGAACRLGIFQGRETVNGRVAEVEASITREEAATMIGRAVGISGTGQTGFADDGDIGPWAKDAISGVSKGAMILGNEQNKFSPQALLTWGEMMGILQSIHENNKLVTPTIQILAGIGEATHLNGTSGKSGVFMPMGLSRDAKGKIYFADQGNNLIRSLDGGVVADYSGVMGPKNLYNLALGGYLDGAKEKAVFNSPRDVQVVADGLLVADSGNNLIRLVKNNQVYTYAGNPKSGYQDGDRKVALFNQPSSLAIDGSGTIYISDTANQVIRQITKNGAVTTIAGTVGQAGFADGQAKSALLCQPTGLAYHDGGLYIADSGNQRIRLLKNGVLTTIAGGGLETYEDSPFIVGDFQDGEALTARFNNPQDLCFGKNGTLYITDMDNGMIRAYNGQKVTTILGFGQAINYQGQPVADLLIQPTGILALDDQLIVTDRFTHYVLGIPLER